MESRRNFIILSLVTIGVLAVGGLLIYRLSGEKIIMRQAAKAAGAMPYQLGIVNAIVIPCMTSGAPPVCVGGMLCSTLDVGRCTLYSDVSGMQAGGMGNQALFMKQAVSMAGLMPGGQLIAGGMGPTLMDSGVLASSGGCYGCMAKAGWKDKILGTYDFIIAGFKGD